MTTPDIEVGDPIGSYRVVGKHVDGVYRAVHETSQRRVQIIVGPAHPVPGLAHPGIAPIVDRGFLAKRCPWLATEVPEGVGLYDLIARRTLPAGEAATLIRHIADVLAFAHERRIVHRALSLRAVVVASSARDYPVCITDWGLPAAARGIYSAPEGSTGDGRADVYALGVIAFRAVTGAWPKVAVDDVPGVPAGLALLIARMLAFVAAERPTAVEVCELARELAAAEMSQPYEEIALEPRPRTAKLRWTPAPMMAITSEQVDEAWGEIKTRE